MYISYYIIAANVIVSLAGLFVNPKVVHVSMLIPFRTVRNKTWYELITSGFVHGSTSHLLFNMITFFFFGPVLESQIGGFQFILLYFSALIVSSIPSLVKH